MDTTARVSRNSPRAVEPLDLMVGARIAARRMALGLSQTTLGERIGVSCQQLQKYENGRNRISAARLHRLALVLGLPIEAFFPEGPEPTQNAELVVIRSLATTAEGRAMADGFARIDDHAVRLALTRLVEVLARAA